MTLRDDIKNANIVADSAESLRQDLRWNVKPGEAEREFEIGLMLERIRLAMEPIRSAMGLLQFGRVPANQEERLRDVSRRLQYERKQLKKMRRR